MKANTRAFSRAAAFVAAGMAAFQTFGPGVAFDQAVADLPPYKSRGHGLSGGALRGNPARFGKGRRTVAQDKRRALKARNRARGRR